jgi:hypothetical protein
VVLVVWKTNGNGTSVYFFIQNWWEFTSATCDTIQNATHDHSFFFLKKKIRAFKKKKIVGLAPVWGHYGLWGVVRPPPRQKSIFFLSHFVLRGGRTTPIGHGGGSTTPRSVCLGVTDGGWFGHPMWPKSYPYNFYFF